MTQKHQQGLTDEQVLKNRASYGSNTLTPPETIPIWRKFLLKFKDTIIIILIVAFLASLCVSFYEFFGENKSWNVFLEPVGIFIAVLLATVVGFIFEMNAERKFKVLNQVNEDVFYKLIRNGEITEISKKDIVVGDLVLLNGGDEIPADGKLLESVSLQVNESTLTGEPITRKSIHEEEESGESPYPIWQVLKGTTVVEGNGMMEVQAVGDHTEYGKVYKGAQIENNIKTPLNIQLDKLGVLITRASYAIAGSIILIRVILLFTTYDVSDTSFVIRYLLNTLMIAVSLIVVSVPEGLPMSVTLSLALSMKRMLATNNLVRKLHACETMGAATVICTDKTGTLTRNQMRVYETNFPNSKDSLDSDFLLELIKESLAINATAFLEKTNDKELKVLGNPTEGALLLWLADKGINYLDVREQNTLKSQLPFSTERKFMASWVVSDALKKNLVYLKGAPEVILNYCNRINVHGEIKPLDEEKKKIEAQLIAYQKQGMRTLAFAYEEVNETQEGTFEKLFTLGELQTHDLILLGIVAISDPIREDVPDAIRETQQAGIQVKIVTGDTATTAKEIGRQIGLWTSQDTEQNCITGSDFESLDERAALDRVKDIKIMSRARPMDKERLVRLLQKQGEVVAVTGDGTNDAPALNAAQVGLSMGDGTSVAKEASDITILDNSFISIGRAVMWGRSLYKNIQRFLFFQLIINVVACIIVFIGSFFQSGAPLTVTQMLWVNLIMDTFAALALASLPPDRIVMKEKPRQVSDHILTPIMRRSILTIAFIFVIFLYGFYRYLALEEVTSLTHFRIDAWWRAFISNPYIGGTISLYEQSLFFTLFVMLQFWNLFNAKVFGTQYSIFHRSKQLLSTFGWVVLAIFIGQILIVSYGGILFQVTPLHLSDWIIITIFTSFVLWIGELQRGVNRIKK